MQCTDTMTMKAVVLLLVLQGTVAIDLQTEGELRNVIVYLEISVIGG